MARGGAEITGRAADLSIYLRALRVSACVIFILVFLVGCGKSSSTVRVTGQLLKDGKSYGARLSGPEPETFVVDFVGNQNGHQYRFPANITSTGSFRVDGAEGRGIPPGQYKINVVHSG